MPEIRVLAEVIPFGAISHWDCMASITTKGNVIFVIDTAFFPAIQFCNGGGEDLVQVEYVLPIEISHLYRISYFYFFEMPELMHTEYNFRYYDT